MKKFRVSLLTPLGMALGAAPFLTRSLTPLGMALALGAAFAGPVWAAVEHKVVEGNHLWGLAKEYYANPYHWRVIAEANTHIVKDPHWIYPGQVLVIPDLAAPPVQASVEASVPVPAAPPAAPEPVKTSDAETSPPRAQEAPEPPSQGEDLSVDMPAAMVASYVSTSRLKAPRDWREDGKITEFEGREIIAAQGDVVNGKLSSQPAVGDKLSVYRRDTVRELDEDAKAVYLQRVGVVEVKEALGKAVYRLLILKSADSVQLGDLLKKD